MLAEGDRYPSIVRSCWLLLLLFVAANLYSIDRAIVGVLAEPIRTDLHIGDVRMGLLLGLAYSLLSGVLGLVLGTLVDRHVRRTVLAGAIVVWSLATAAGGLAPNFTWFFVFRSLVGLGEAAIGPAAVSLIADMFSPSQRGRALGIYLIGATIGSALSSVIPGRVVGADLQLHLGSYGALSPWRSAFLLCGLPGPIIGLLFLTVREPVRRGTPDGARRTGISLADKLRYLWLHRSFTMPLVIGFCLFYVAYAGLSSWSVAFLTRTYHQPLAAFSGKLALMMLLAGISGYVSGGLITDSLLDGSRDGKVIAMAVVSLIALPSTCAVMAPNIIVALLALATLSFATPILNVLMSASIQDSIPNEMRGFSFALLSMLNALPAGAGGPLAVALVTRYALGGDSELGRAFMILGVPALFTAALCFLRARSALRGMTMDGSYPSPLARVSDN